jgi:hypothetical protein
LISLVLPTLIITRFTLRERHGLRGNIRRMRELLSIARPDHVVKAIRACCIEKSSEAGRKLKIRQPLGQTSEFLARSAIASIRKRTLAFRLSVQWIGAFKTRCSVTWTTRRDIDCIHQAVDTAVQIIVDPAKLPSGFQAKRGKPKSRQHGHQDQAVPNLQSPAYGFENHDQFSMQ